MAQSAKPDKESANRGDDARGLLAEFVRAWDRQFPRAEVATSGEFAPLLADMNRLMRRARALIDPAAPS